MPSPPAVRRGRPPRLSLDEIVVAASRFDLADLSMHALARELGVTHAALYRWVGSREALVDLINDRVIERITPEAGPVAGDWRGWLSRLAYAMRSEFLAVPGYATRAVRPHQHSAAYDRLQQTVTDALQVDAGLTKEQAIQSWYVFATSIIGWLAVEQGRQAQLDPKPDFQALVDVLLAGLPQG